MLLCKKRQQHAISNSKTGKCCKFFKKHYGPLTELAGDLLLREQVFRVHRSLEVLFQDGQYNGLLFWLPNTPCQQHVP